MAHWRSLITLSYLSCMKKHLGHHFVEYINLTKDDISNMTLQELFDHKFEVLRKHEIGLRLIDEMEDRQSNM